MAERIRVMARHYFKKGNRLGGRKPGTPNRASVEARTLASELVTNIAYQERLRRDFMRRKVHPTIESLIWQYHIGKPVQPVLMGGSIDVGSRLADERKVFAALDLSDLEQLAAESQRLVDRAYQLAGIAAGDVIPASPPQDVVVQSGPQKNGAESLTKCAESDNAYSVNPQPATDPAPDPRRAPSDNSHEDKD